MDDTNLEEVSLHDEEDPNAVKSKLDSQDNTPMTQEEFVESNRKFIKFKVLVVGQPAVGKTSFVQRYVHGLFSEKYKSTMGVDFAYKKLKWNEKFDIDLQLWDLAGQERIGTQIRIYFKDTHGVICMCDATEQETQAKVADWKKLVDERCTRANGDTYAPPAILLINKIDALIDRELPQEEIDAIAAQLGFKRGFGTSVKDKINMNESIDFLVKKMFEQREQDIKNGVVVDPAENIEEDDRVFIEEAGPARRGGCGC